MDYPFVVAYPGFCEREAPLGGLGEGSSPAGSRGRAPSGGLGASPQKVSDFCKY